MPDKRRYESSLERDLMELVRDEPDHERLDDQPVSIPYALGKQTYTLDSFIVWKTSVRGWRKSSTVRTSTGNGVSCARSCRRLRHTLKHEAGTSMF